MRPTDENQHGSTRPNFMSATRRAYAGDDNILARLERDAKRGRSGKPGAWKQARLAWCLLASVLVIALIGTLATLARENLSAPRKSALADAAPAPTDPYGSDIRGGFAPLPVPAPNRNLAAAALAGPSAPAPMPPMVMLKTAPAPIVAPNAAAPASARAAAAKPVARAQPERIAAAVKPAPARPQARAPAAAPRSVAATAPARAKKPASAPTAAPDAVPLDSDVALLSAIIMHASRHSAERAQMEAARCGPGKKCVSADLPSLKATD